MPEGYTLSLIVLSGTIEVDGWEVARAGQTIVLGCKGAPVSIESNGEAKLLMLASELIDELVVAHGPFVMNTVDEVRQAMLDFQFGHVAKCDVA